VSATPRTRHARGAAAAHVHDDLALLIKTLVNVASEMSAQVKRKNTTKLTIKSVLVKYSRESARPRRPRMEECGRGSERFSV